MALCPGSSGTLRTLVVASVSLLLLDHSAPAPDRPLPQQNQPDLPPVEGFGDFSGVTGIPIGSHPVPLSAPSQGSCSEDTVLIIFPARASCRTEERNHRTAHLTPNPVPPPGLF